MTRGGDTTEDFVVCYINVTGTVMWRIVYTSVWHVICMIRCVSGHTNDISIRDNPHSINGLASSWSIREDGTPSSFIARYLAQPLMENEPRCPNSATSTWRCTWHHIPTSSTELLTCGLTLIPAWISNYIHYNTWDEITYPFLNFNGCTVEV